MNNIQKAFKTKNKCGLRLALGTGSITNASDSSLEGQPSSTSVVNDLQKRVDFMHQSNADLQNTIAAQNPTPQLPPKQPFGPNDPIKQVNNGAVPNPTTLMNNQLTGPQQTGNGYQFGLQSPDGQGAQHQFGVKSMTDIANEQQAGRSQRRAGLRALGLGGIQQGLYMAEGGIVKGKGGPTSDEVPMNISGTDVNLSNSEAVLPAKTVEALGGPKAVEALIEHTNGKPPVKSGLRAGGEYNTGNVYTVDAAGNVVTNGAKAAPSGAGTINVDPAGNAARAGQVAGALPNGVPNPNAGTAVVPAQQPVVSPAPPLQAQGAAPAAAAGPSVWTKQHTVGGAAKQGMRAAGQALNFAAKNPLPAAGVVMGGMDAADIIENGANTKNVSGATAGALTAAELAAPALGYAAAAPALAIGAAGAAGVRTGAQLNEDAQAGKQDLRGVTNLGLGNALHNFGTFVGRGAARILNPELSDSFDKVDSDEIAAKAEAGDKPWEGGFFSRAATAAPSKAPTAPVVNKSFQDKDTRSAEQIAWDAQQNETETKGLRAAQQFFGPNGRIPDGFKTVRQNETNAPMGIWNSKNDATAGTIGNMKDGSWIKPEQGTGIVSIKQKDGSYKNVAMGRSEYTAADGTQTNDWSKTAQFAQGTADAERARQSLRSMERARYVRDQQADITDPRARAEGAQGIARMNGEDAAVATAANHKEEMGLRRDQLAQQDRHFNETQKTARATAATAAEAKRLADVDTLLGAEDFGDKKMNARWVDFARANFVGGVDKDGKPTKGLEGLDANQARNQLPILKAKFEINERARKGALDKTSIKDISGGEKRDVTLKDIDWNAWGVPDVTDSGDPRRLSFAEYMRRKWTDPNMSSKIYVDPQGNRFRMSDVRGEAGTLGSGDVDQLLSKAK